MDPFVQQKDLDDAKLEYIGLLQEESLLKEEYPLQVSMFRETSVHDAELEYNSLQQDESWLKLTCRHIIKPPPHLLI